MYDYIYITKQVYNCFSFNNYFIDHMGANNSSFFFASSDIRSRLRRAFARGEGIESSVMLRNVNDMYDAWVLEFDSNDDIRIRSMDTMAIVCERTSEIYNDDSWLVIEGDGDGITRQQHEGEGVINRIRVSVSFSSKYMAKVDLFRGERLVSVLEYMCI